MDAEVIDCLSRITLTRDKGEEIKIRLTHRDHVLEACSLSLIGKFLSARILNIRAANNLLRSFWKMGNDLRIVDVGEGMFQFQFILESQLQWVLSNGLWSFEN